MRTEFQSQHPFAIIVGCSDPRTPPEMIFDQNIGDLFVAAPPVKWWTTTPSAASNMRSSTLGARLIVVLGHSRCGAVAAAVASDHAPGHVGEIVRSIRPGVEAVRGQEGDLLTNAFKKNVDRVSEKIREKAELGALADSTRVVEAYYDLESGKVQWLTP